VRWLRRIYAVPANWVAAGERALGAGDAESAARLCSALSLYWWVGGHLVLGRRLTHAALEGELPEPVRIRALIAEATMAFAQDDHGAAARIWQRALDLARSCGDVAGQAHALPGLGVAALVTGDLGVAETAFRTTLMLAEAVGAEGEWVAALTEVWLGTVLVHRDDREGAVQHITRGLESARRRGDLLTSYIALYNLAQVADDQAPERLREGIELAVQTRDAANLAHFLEALAVAETPLGAPRRVAVLLGAAGALLEQAGFQVYGYYLPDTARRDAAASAARDALGPDGYDDAVDEGRALGLDGAVAYALGR
jgi:tetratricopeptide (TPR) repeat protein